MSTLALGAVAALAAGYLDARHLIKHDFEVASRVLTSDVKFLINQKRGLVNVIYILEEHAKRRPNDLALAYAKPLSTEYPKDPKAPLDDFFKVEKYTWKQMFGQVYKYASLLKFKYGIKSNDCVALYCMNNTDFIFVWLALWSLGATPVFINYNLADTSLLHCIRISNSKYIITDPEVASNIVALEKEIAQLGKQAVFMNDEFHASVESSKPYKAATQEQNQGKEPWSPAMFIYTSGTTGAPKAAPFSWVKTGAGALSYGVVMRMSKKDVVYSSMPLYHSTASALGFMAALLNGAAYAIGHKFSARTFWTQAKLCDATYVQYVGEVCRYLLNSPEGPDDKAHKVKCATGNGMRPDVWRRFKERFNVKVIGEFYGATEYPTALTNYQEGERAVGAVASYGRAIRTLVNQRYRIVAVDPDDPNELWRDPVTGFGRRTKPDEPGELLFSIADPKNVETSFQGYAGDKKSTNSKVVRNLFKKGDAYVRSGDLLKFDDHGLAYFVDRMGDTFRWKSENVSTNEVEEAISDIPGVQQVVVVGVQVPNHEGRAGFAVIQPSNPEKLPDLDLIATQLSKRLPKYAVPVFLKVSSTAIENTGTMKVQKTRYRNQKIPSPEETIYCFRDGVYVPISEEFWQKVTAGKARL